VYRDECHNLVQHVCEEHIKVPVPVPVPVPHPHPFVRGLPLRAKRDPIHKHYGGNSASFAGPLRGKRDHNQDDHKGPSPAPFIGTAVGPDHKDKSPSPRTKRQAQGGLRSLGVRAGSFIDQQNLGLVRGSEGLLRGSAQVRFQNTGSTEQTRLSSAIKELLRLSEKVEDQKLRDTILRLSSSSRTGRQLQGESGSQLQAEVLVERLKELVAQRSGPLSPLPIPPVDPVPTFHTAEIPAPPGCRSVVTQKCIKVPEKVQVRVPQQICKDVPDVECHLELTDVQEPVCDTVPIEECNDFLKEIPYLEPEEECEDVVRLACTEVEESVPIQVCTSIDINRDVIISSYGETYEVEGNTPLKTTAEIVGRIPVLTGSDDEDDNRLRTGGRQTQDERALEALRDKIFRASSVRDRGGRSNDDNQNGGRSSQNGGRSSQNGERSSQNGGRSPTRENRNGRSQTTDRDEKLKSFLSRLLNENK